MRTAAANVVSPLGKQGGLSNVAWGDNCSSLAEQSSAFVTPLAVATIPPRLKIAAQQPFCLAGIGVPLLRTFATRSNRTSRVAWQALAVPAQAHAVDMITGQAAGSPEQPPFVEQLGVPRPSGQPKQQRAMQHY
jgi:hypothetical protein